MATITPGNETYDPMLADVDTYEIDLTAADAGLTPLIVLDLRTAKRVQFQYNGTAPTGTITISAGLPGAPRGTGMFRLVPSNTGTAAITGIATSGVIYEAARESPANVMPENIALTVAATWVGVGKLYIRIER